VTECIYKPPKEGASEYKRGYMVHVAPKVSSQL